MVVLSRWILVLATLLAAGPRLLAASSAETRAFNAATNTFRLGFYDRAEAAFASFAQTYTNSARLAEAILYEAEARIQQTNYTGAIELLLARQGSAGTNADQYLFWLAEAHFRKGDHPAAQAAPASPADGESPGTHHVASSTLSSAARTRITVVTAGRSCSRAMLPASPRFVQH